MPIAFTEPGAMTKPRNTLENWLAENALKVLAWTAGVVALLTLIFIGFYVKGLGSTSLSTAPADWGTFGDYFGGTLGPVLSSISIIALLATLAVQRKEARDNAAELVKRDRANAVQAFEQTFFSWLGNYRDLLGEVEAQGAIDIQRGRRALRFWWVNEFCGLRVWGKLQEANNHVNREITSEISDLALPFELFCQPESWDICFRMLAPPHKVVASNMALRLWEGLYMREEYNLDNLFRVLYRLILWIDSQDENILGPAKKWFYVSIVRSQLSWIELIFLYFNGLTPRGDRFKRLAERYALFDNLTLTSDPILENLRYWPPQGFPTYQDRAYDSNTARHLQGLPIDGDEVLVKAMAQ